jgi:hypothetical protein
MRDAVMNDKSNSHVRHEPSVRLGDGGDRHVPLKQADRGRNELKEALPRLESGLSMAVSSMAARKRERKRGGGEGWGRGGRQ